MPNNFNSSNERRQRVELHPKRDWQVLLLALLIVFTCTVVWHMNIFDTIIKGGVIGNNGVNTAQSVDETSLETMKAVFLNRSIEEEKYISGKYKYTDPSQ